MADAPKILGQSKPAATTATALYTVPVATSAAPVSVCVCNQSASADTYRIWIRVAGAATAVAQYLAYDVSLAGNQSYNFSLPFGMAATDILMVYSGGGNLSFTAGGVEIT